MKGINYNDKSAVRFSCTEHFSICLLTELGLQATNVTLLFLIIVTIHQLHFKQQLAVVFRKKSSDKPTVSFMSSTKQQ